MAIENDRQSLRDYGIRKKRYKRRRNALIIAVILMVIIGAGLYVISLYNRQYQSMVVMNTADITASDAVGYLEYGNSIIKYGMNGVVAMDKNGKLLWNGSYELQEPLVDTCGKYVVVAGKGTKEVYVFNNKGLAGEFNTDFNILKVEVGSQGHVLAMMEDKNTNYIRLYDIDGTVIYEIISDIKTVGYPLDAALSYDGRKVVTSYISFTDGKLKNILSFYNFGEVGQNYTNQLVGCIIYEDGTIAPKVEFVNNNTVSVYTDTGFVLYAMEQIPSEIIAHKINGQIRSIISNEKYVGLVTQAEGASAKKLSLFDLSGKKILEKELDFNYEKIYLSNGEIIMHDNMSCLIMKLNGKIKFRHTFDSNIKAIYSANRLDQYFLAEEKAIRVIQLKE